jgi:uncharacterized protein YbcI
MNKSQTGMAQQIAQAAIAFEQRRTGNHGPKSVTVVLSEGTLVITLHKALSRPRRLSRRLQPVPPRYQEFHRQLFANSDDALRQEIQRITGVEVREATVEVETTTGAVTTGAVMQRFATGTVVQVFLLAGSVPADTWNGSGPGDQS